MTGFMDWICKSRWMLWDLLPRHNGLWVSVLKMLISPTFSLYGAFFSSGLLLFDHLSSEKAAGNAGSCAVRCCWCDGAEDATPRWEKPIQLCRIMKSQMDFVSYILICGFISTCAAVKGKCSWCTWADQQLLTHLMLILGLSVRLTIKQSETLWCWALWRETCSFAFKRPLHRFMATNGITKQDGRQWKVTDLPFIQREHVSSRIVTSNPFQINRGNNFTDWLYCRLCLQTIWKLTVGGCLSHFEAHGRTDC